VPTIITLPGDGIGPEIMQAALRVLQAVAPDVETTEHLFGGAAIDGAGSSLPDETLSACRAADAVLLAAVGGPKWDTTDAKADRPERGLLGLRKELGLFANLRPVRPLPALYDASPLKRELIEGTDMLVIRELTGGIYFGEKTRTETRASDLCVYTTEEIERIARVAFTSARAKVTSVDKANVLETSRLWREVVGTCHPRVPDVQLEHALVDSTAMQLVSAPRQFDVILTENMFGDILSDEAAMLTGSLGMLPSASLGAEGDPGVFEPGPRQRPRHRGPGHREPAGDDPLAGHAPAPRTRAGGRGRGRRIGGGRSPRRRPAHPRPRWAGEHRRGVCCRARPPALGGATWSSPRLIWMNGEFVAWETRRSTCSPTGCTTATGVFEGIRCYDHGDRPGGLPPRRPRRPALPVRRAVLHAAAVLPRAAARGHARAHRPQQPALVLHPPDRLPGLRHMGLFPLDAPVDVSIAVWKWGAYLGEESKQRGRAREGLLLAAHQRESLIPQAKACGQYLNSVLAKIESHKAGYEEGILLDQHGFVCEGTGENLFVVREGGSSRRRSPRRSSTASTAGRRCRSRATSATSSSSRTSTRADLYLADEIYMTGTAAELTPIREVDDHPIGTGEPGPSHERGADHVRGRAARARRALPGVARSRAGRRDDVIELYDATLRAGMGGAGINVPDPPTRRCGSSTSSTSSACT
jgi:3-isopropylmalate dehydrogenase